MPAVSPRDMDHPFDIREDQRSNGVMVIAVRGVIDLFTAPEFKAGLFGVIDRGTDRIVVDFSETLFVDSSALAALLAARKRLAGRHGQLAIAGLNPRLTDTFRLTGLDQLFLVETSCERAVDVLAETMP